MVKKSEAFDDLHAHAAVVVRTFPETSLVIATVYGAVGQEVDVPHYVFRLYPPVQLAVCLLPVDEVFVYHASVGVQPFIGCPGYPDDDGFYPFQQRRVAQYQCRFVDEPRGFDVVSVGDDVVFVGPVFFEEQVEVSGLWVEDAADEYFNQVP